MKRLFLAAILIASVVSGAPQGINGSVEGTVVDSRTGDPIRDIQVRLGEKSGTSNRDGHFRIAGIPPGEYEVQVSQKGYFVGSGFSAADSIPLGKIRIAAREQIRDFTFEMAQAGVISGHIWNPNGTPATNVFPQLLQMRYSVRGEQDLIFASLPKQSTDDRGEYRVWNLVPGRYFVLASPQESGLSVSSNGRIVSLHPSARALGKAAPVTVTGGAETSNTDVILQTGQTTPVTVDVVTTTGIPIMSGTLRVVPKNMDDMSGDMRSCILWACQLTPRGRLTMPGILDGEYTLVAEFYGKDERRYTGKTVIYVDRQLADPVNMIVAPEESVTVKGTVVIRGPGGTFAGSSIPIGLTSPTHRVVPSKFPAPGELVVAGGIDVGAVFALNSFKPEFTNEFTFRIVVKDRYQIVPYPPAGFYIADVRQGEKSVLESGVIIGDEPLEPLEVVLDAGGGTIRGTVRSSRQVDIGYATVYLIPVSRSAVFTQTAKSDHSGSFSFENVPPGDYLLYSWFEIPIYACFNADFMKRYEGRGTPVSIGEGRQSVNRTVIRIPVE